MNEKELKDYQATSQQIVKTWISLIVNHVLYVIAVVGWIISLFNNNIKWGWICIITMILLTFVSNIIRKQLNALAKYFIDTYGEKNDEKNTPTK